MTDSNFPYKMQHHDHPQEDFIDTRTYCVLCHRPGAASSPYLISSFCYDDAKSLTAGAKTYITIKSSTHWCSINVHWLNKHWMASQTWPTLLGVGHSDLLVHNFLKIVFQFIKSTGMDFDLRSDRQPNAYLWGQLTSRRFFSFSVLF